VYFGLFLAGVGVGTPALETTQVEARVNSDNERQQTDQTSELHGTQDMNSSTEEFSEIQRVSKPTIDRDTEDGRTKVLAGPSGDKDMEDNQNKARAELGEIGDLEGAQNKPENIPDSRNKSRTELAVSGDLDGQNKPEIAPDSQNLAQTESAVCGDLEDGENKPENTPDYGRNLEDVRDEVPVKTISKEDAVVETGTTAEMLTDSQEQTGSDGVEDAVTEDGEMVMDDAMSEDQFLSPAASEPDISGRSSPTMEQAAAEPGDIEDREPIGVAGGTKTWSSKVPLLQTEPPAMDSDYEEAPSLDMEELPLTSEEVRQSGRALEEEEHGKLDADENFSDEATPAATATAAVKSTAM